MDVKYIEYNGKPILLLERFNGKENTSRCAFCRSTHIHGSSEGHRTPHCAEGHKDMVEAADGTVLYFSNGYYIKNVSTNCKCGASLYKNTYGNRTKCKKCSSSEMYAKSKESGLAPIKKKRYYEANKDRILQQEKERYLTKKEKVIKAAAEWRKANPDKYKKCKRQYKYKQVQNVGDTYIKDALRREGKSLDESTIELRKSSILIKRIKRQLNKIKTA